MHKLVLFCLVFTLFFITNSVFAQDPERFPHGSDVDAYNKARKTLWGVGGREYETRVGMQEFLSEYWDGSSFKEHPWYDGRQIPESAHDYALDSLRALKGRDGELDLLHFVDCFDLRPRTILPNAPTKCTKYCNPHFFFLDWGCTEADNTGYMFNYWWPEVEIEVNNFGIAALNPIAAMRPDLKHDILAGAVRQMFSLPDSPLAVYLSTRGGKQDDKLPAGLSRGRNIGQTHYEGTIPEDQTLVMESHIYNTAVNYNASKAIKETKGELGLKFVKTKTGPCVPDDLFWYNGYKKGNHECFYNTLDKQKEIIKAWSEEVPYAPFWRIPPLSAMVNHKYYIAAVEPPVPFGACTGFRAKKWPERYGDLVTAVGVMPSVLPSQERVCYEGGGQLFPLTGTMPSQFSPGVSAAYLTLRALYLNGRMGVLRANRFSEFADKLQRVSPDTTKCFMTNKIDDENVDLFPPDLLKPYHTKREKMTSIRYVYWNMRTACVCQYRGNYPVPFVSLEFLPYGWGCHPYEFTDVSRGDVEDQNSPPSVINISAKAALLGPYGESVRQVHYGLPKAVSPF